MAYKTRRCGYRYNRLRVLTQERWLNEPPYRSSGEAQIGRMLQRYDVPAVYEYPTLVYDRGCRRIWHPDFTLPVADLIIEYAGMPEVHDYRLGMDHKQHVYGANGLKALFVQPDDIGGPAWSERLLDRICRAASYSPVPYRGPVLERQP